jgi:hypothetical protein
MGGFARELRHRLNYVFEIHVIIKAGSTLGRFVKTTCSDLNTLTKTYV